MTQDEIIAQLRTVLGQCLGALSETANYLSLQAEAQAALHCSTGQVVYPPLHAAVLQTVSDAHHVLHWSGHLARDPASPPPIDLPRVTKLHPPAPARSTQMK